MLRPAPFRPKALLAGRFPLTVAALARTRVCTSPWHVAYRGLLGHKLPFVLGEYAGALAIATACDDASLAARVPDLSRAEQGLLAAVLLDGIVLRCTV